MANKQGDKSKKSDTTSSNKASDKGARGADSIAESQKSQSTLSHGSLSGSSPSGSESPTQEIITAFGGLRPLASKLGIAVSTVQGWKERDSIPSSRHEEILQAAAKAKITLNVARVRESDHLHVEESGSATESEKAGLTSSASTEIKGSVPSSGGKSSESKKADLNKMSSTKSVASDNKQIEKLSPEPKSGQKSARKGGGLNSFFYGIGFCTLAVAGIVFFRGEWLPLVEKLPAFSGGQSLSSSASLEKRIAGLELQASDSQNQGVDENRFLSLSEEVRTLKLKQSELNKLLGDLTKGGVVVTAGDVDRGLMDALRAEVEATGKRLQELENSTKVSPSVSVNSSQASAVGLKELNALKSQLASLSSKVETLKSSQAGNSGSGQATVTAPATKDVYLALGVLQLRDALRGSSPFVKELDLLRAVTQENGTVQDLISPLSAFAASGLPSMTELRADFPAAAREALSADKIAGGQTWMDKAIGRVTDVVSIRPIDVLDGIGSGSILARAENYLLGSDLTGALRELEGLTTAATSGMEDWLRLAKQRQSGERISGKLALLLIGVTQQGSGIGGVE